MSVVEAGVVDEAQVIAELVETLMKKYPQSDPHGISELVRSLWARYDGARIRDFIPILVEHSARETLSLGVSPSWSS